MIEVDYNAVNWPLELSVVQSGSGVPGLTATVAIRQGGTTNSYLDWADNTFKTSGWTTKNEPMADLGTGVYQAAIDVAALGFTPLTGLPRELVAEYSIVGYSGVGGIDYIIVSELRPDAKTSRQFNTNKLAALAPGVLTLYADDGVTVQSTQPLTDATGGAVSNTPGSPQVRGPV